MEFKVSLGNSVKLGLKIKSQRRTRDVTQWQRTCLAGLRSWVQSLTSITFKKLKRNLRKKLHRENHAPGCKAVAREAIGPPGEPIDVSLINHCVFKPSSKYL